MVANPFHGIVIGSTVDMSGGFHGSALGSQAQITTMVSAPNVTKSMRGQSDLVYTTQMNQASISIAGAYGVSGLEKVTAAVSAYAGAASAESEKSVSVTCEVVMSAGIETVQFDDLSPVQMLTALSGAPRALLADVLDCYSKLMADLGGNSLLVVLSDAQHSAHSAVTASYGKWARAVEYFRANYHEGVVVGVVWGGIGWSTIHIDDHAGARSWKYGGTADFSFAGTGASLAIGATYDASGSSETGKITVRCESDSSGNCVRGYVDAWDEKLQGKAFDAVATIRPLGLTPPDIKARPLPAPQFTEPKKDAKATAAAAGMTKDGLGDLSKAAAYDRFKAAYGRMRRPGDPEFSVRLDEFLRMAEQRPDPRPMRDFQRAVTRNSLSTLSLKDSSAERGLVASAVARVAEPTAIDDLIAGAAAAAGRASGPVAPARNDDYVPIGVWVSNWSDLFPWLAAGWANGVDDASDAATLVKFRMMQQDFLTLSRLYQYAANCSLSVPSEPDFAPSDLVQIADNFAARYDELRNVNPMSADCAAAAAEAVDHLSDQSSKIYRRWDDIRFLRNCELGLGVVKADKFSLKIPTEDFLKGVPGFAVYAADEACSFRLSSRNYDAFAKSYKLLPLILPSKGQILAFGPASGVLCEYENFAYRIGGSTQLVADYNKATGAAPPPTTLFSPVAGRRQKDFGPVYDVHADVNFIEFDPNLIGGYLENAKKNIKLYPIPFSGISESVTWKGQSFSTNVASDKALNEKLKALADDLEHSPMKAWSYSSDTLGEGWRADSFYTPLGVRKQYFGIIKKPTAAAW